MSSADVARERIRQAATAEVLDLSNLSLTEAPPGLGELTQLQTLILGGNKLTALPREVLKLRKLRRLFLGGNKLKELPREIVQLEQLEELYLGASTEEVNDAGKKLLTYSTKQLSEFNLPPSNQLSSLPVEIKQLAQLHTLDLRNNQLRSLPAEIVQLTQLSTLYLSDNKLGTLPPEIAQLTHLHTLDLRNNQLSSLPIEIGQLTQLQNIDLHSNWLNSFPTEIGQLTQLQTLDLRNNRLSSLPTEIAQLSKLHTLELNDNRLNSLPAEIGQLVQLQKISLSANALNNLPAEIGQLTQLQKLDLSGNKLSALPAGVVRLAKLQELYLSANALNSLPAEIGQLTQLHTLDLRYNALKSLPAEIGQLTQLHALYCRYNQLSSLPPKIGQLTQLQKLYLSGNALNSLPAEIGQLTRLHTLDLRNNRLSSLPAEIDKLTQLQILDLRNNEKLGIPLEILGSETQWRTPNRLPSEILAYYSRLRQASRPLLEAKVLIVGQGAVGKSSLVKRLVHDIFDPDQGKTEGIDIVRWGFPSSQIPDASIRVNIWDFGGQEIMHATHQFFLTKRSLYLLVLDARKGENEGNLHYWLRIIQSFGADAPVLVVVNKHEPPNELELNENRLRRDFAPNIRGFFRTSCENGKGLPELREAICEEVQKLEHVYDEVPSSYFAVKELLEKRTEEEDYLEHETYEGVCREHGIEKPSEQRLLLGFLHDLGSVLHFDDEDSPYPLAETKILNPEWVTRGVYKILNNNPLMQAKGVLTLSQLDRILTAEHGYPKDRRLFIIGMMRKFELCFDYPSQDGRLLVAELLSKNEPELGFDEASALRFEYHYAVLPEGILPRFIVRMAEHLTQRSTYWRSGVVVEIDGQRALVRGDTQAGRVYIAIFDDRRGRRRALAVIRSQLKAIHQTISGLGVKGMVPLPRDPGLAVGYEHLLKLERLGQSSFLPEGAQHPYQVRELLDGVEERHHRALAGSINVEGDFYMSGDKYENRGQVAAMGRTARAEGNTFQQIQGGDFDLPRLAEELATLRASLQQQASQPEQYVALAAVAQAEEAAQQGDGSEALAKLKGASRWALDAATKIGTAVAAKAIQTSLGI